tara:strand:- start:4569 stop:5588 length:1020 start_codon:yes stop_codon:yes gene_type:complete
MDKVVIAIPVYNEEEFIEKCLNSVLAFEIPDGITHEIWIIDGGSTDKTLSIAKKIQKNNKLIQLVNNPNKTQSHAMNLSIEESNSDWLMRLDGHSIYPSNYLKLLFETAQSTSSSNVGGMWDIQRMGETLSDYMVHSLISHSFGVGNSGFRTGVKSGEVDTVPFGFFKMEVFEEIGLFDNRLIRGQDYEFNRRLIKNGFKVWLNPDIRIKYFPKGNIIDVLKKYHFLEAPYNAYMWYIAPYTFSIRHVITSLFVLGLIGGGILSLYSELILTIYISVLSFYLFISIISSLQLSIKNKKLLLLFIMPFIFFIFHLAHGIGVIKGSLKLIFGIAPISNISN